MAWAPYALMAAGSIFEGVSGKQTAEDNQAIAKQMARREAAVGQLKAEQLRRQNRLLVGKQVAAFSTSGVDLTGSPTDLIAQDAQQAELDALNAQYEGLTRRNAYRFQADQYQQQGKQALFGSLLTASAYGAGGYASTIKPPTVAPGGGGGAGSVQ